MAKRPFRKFNSKDFVNAVQVTDENIDALADQLGGERNSSPGPMYLPGIPTALEAEPGDYIILRDNGRYSVVQKDHFEELYKIPKTATDDDEDEDDEESEEE